MARRDEIDSKENAIDNRHDLPVYHRVQSLLTTLNNHLEKFDHTRKVSFRAITPIVFQFDKTLAPILGRLLMKTIENKEELEDLFKTLQENLPEKYFEFVLTQLASVIKDNNACAFIHQLDTNEKLQFARWFIKEKNRGLAMFELLKDTVFNQTDADRQQCQELLQQLRQCDNLYIRQQAMEYTVEWKEEGDEDSGDNNESSDEAMED
ncbi:unnamed protein product [Adineta ricciae]|nr:unnamed protein product [Adineta ricciae]